MGWFWLTSPFPSPLPSYLHLHLHVCDVEIWNCLPTCKMRLGKAPSINCRMFSHKTLDWAEELASEGEETRGFICRLIIARKTAWQFFSRLAVVTAVSRQLCHLFLLVSLSPPLLPPTPPFYLLLSSISPYLLFHPLTHSVTDIHPISDNHISHLTH